MTEAPLARPERVCGGRAQKLKRVEAESSAERVARSACLRASRFRRSRALLHAQSFCRTQSTI